MANRVAHFLELALAQVGDEYIVGAGRDYGNADPESFDCSGLVAWALSRSGGMYEGTFKVAASLYQWSEQSGTTMSVQDALNTPGALLFSANNTSRYKNIGHVAISLGNGSDVVEARGRAYGVVRGASSAGRWAYGSLVPTIKNDYAALTGDPDLLNRTLSRTGTGSGGGGTGGAPPVATDEEYRRVLEDRFGAFSWLTDHPEVGPLLRRAFSEGMSWAAFQSALQGTNWWRSRSESTRKWDAIYATDPGEAARQVNDRRGDLARLASTLGVNLSRERAQMIAFQSLRFGWGEDDLQRAVLAEAKYRRRQEGDLGAMATQVKSIAAQYGIGAPDERAFKFAKQILGGQMTIDGIRQRYANQAKALFPAFRDVLDTGATVSDIAAPYVDQAARLLEVGPEQIDLTDPKFQRALTHRGKDGKAQPLSLGEWSELLMSDERYGWEKTNNARDAAYGMVRQLATRFGGYA